MSQLFKNYLDFSKSAQRINQRYKINDYKERLVLEAVVSAYVDGIEFGVLDLVLLDEIASQATLHNVMKGLIAKKLIKTQVSNADARRKHVLPTKLGLLWLKECSKLLFGARKR